MKTQVIHLDSHDDVTSICDKMSWARSTRLLLVFPRRAYSPTRPLDLRLIQRHAVALGAQLAIVAPRLEVRETARELGIPVYKTPALAQRRAWRSLPPPEFPHPHADGQDLRQMRREVFPAEPRWRSLLGVRLAFFSLAVLAVLGLLVLFLPSASIRLTPKTRTQSLTIAVSASQAVTAVNLSGSLPAHLAVTALEGSKTAPVSGTLTLPDAPAVGLVRFRNETTGTIGIPSGTVVRTTGDPPVRFATTTDAVMPAGAGKTMDVPVQAIQPGSSGNLAANTLVAIEGDLGASLAVTNPGPTAGGTDKQAPVQTTADRSALQSALEAELLSGCATTLQGTLAEGDLLFPDTLKSAQVLSETYFPAPDQAGETLSLTMKLECQAEYASASDVLSLAGQVLDANLPKGFEPASGNVTAPLTAQPQTDAQGVTHWQVEAQRALQARLDPLAVVQLVRGLSPSRAAGRLKTDLDLGAAPQIHLTPTWWPWLPLLPFRISVAVGG